MKKEVMNKKKMLILDMLAVAVMILADQWTKQLAIVHLKEKQAYVLIDGVLELDYLENRGAAFGTLQNQKLILLFLGVAAVALMLFFLLKLPMQKKFYPAQICCAGIIAGGVGNMIDRVRYDYVVDFVSFVLIHYPIFNVADIFVVLSVIGLMLLFLFVYKEEDLAFLSFRGKKEV